MILSSWKVEEFQQIAERNDTENLSVTVRLEARERVGISQFFSGDYRSAYDTLRETLTVTTNEDGTELRRHPVHSNYVKVLLGNINFRWGDLLQAETFFTTVVDELKFLDTFTVDSNELMAIALSNSAIVHYALGKTKQAIDEADESLAVLMKDHVLSSPGMHSVYSVYVYI